MSVQFQATPPTSPPTAAMPPPNSPPPSTPRRQVSSPLTHPSFSNSDPSSSPFFTTTKPSKQPSTNPTNPDPHPIRRQTHINNNDESGVSQNSNHQPPLQQYLKPPSFISRRRGSSNFFNSSKKRANFSSASTTTATAKGEGYDPQSHCNNSADYGSVDDNDISRDNSVETNDSYSSSSISSSFRRQQLVSSYSASSYSLASDPSQDYPHGSVDEDYEQNDNDDDIDNCDKNEFDTTVVGDSDGGSLSNRHQNDNEYRDVDQHGDEDGDEYDSLLITAQSVVHPTKSDKSSSFDLLQSSDSHQNRIRKRRKMAGHQQQTNTNNSSAAIESDGDDGEDDYINHNGSGRLLLTDNENSSTIKIESDNPTTNNVIKSAYSASSSSSSDLDPSSSNQNRTGIIHSSTSKVQQQEQKEERGRKTTTATTVILRKSASSAIVQEHFGAAAVGEEDDPTISSNINKSSTLTSMIASTSTTHELFAKYLFSAESTTETPNDPRSSLLEKEAAVAVGTGKTTVKRQSAVIDPALDIIGVDDEEEDEGRGKNNNYNGDVLLSSLHEHRSIESSTLSNIISDVADSVLIVDCRRFIEYNTSHIRSAVNICCNKLVRRRLQENKMTALDLLQQQLNACGVTNPYRTFGDLTIVLYDHQSFGQFAARRKSSLDSKKKRMDEPKIKRKLSASASKADDNCPFIDFLLEKLSDCTQLAHVAMLKGGFLDFQSRYPELCEGAAPGGGVAATPGRGASARLSLSSLSQPCLPVSNQGPTKILPFLYLGSQQDALDFEVLKRHGIYYVLNLSNSCPRPDFLCEDNFLRIPVNDSYTEKLLPHFEEAFSFLDKVRETNGCVLIHCLAGISRSPTLAIAYTMRHFHMSQDEAYRFVKEKRPSISPNFNFLGQLLEYEKLLRARQRKELNDKCKKTRRKVLVPSMVSPRFPANADPMPALKSAIVSDREKGTIFRTTSLDTTGVVIKRSFSCPVTIQMLGLNTNDVWWSSASPQRPSAIGDQTTGGNREGKRLRMQNRSVGEFEGIEVHKMASPETSTSAAKATAVIPEMDQSKTSCNIGVTSWPSAPVAASIKTASLTLSSPPKRPFQFPLCDSTNTIPNPPSRPTGLSGLQSRKPLGLLTQPPPEDLPSPSTELSKLSFGGSSNNQKGPSFPADMFSTTSTTPGSYQQQQQQQKSLSFAGGMPTKRDPIVTPESAFVDDEDIMDFTSIGNSRSGGGPGGGSEAMTTSDYASSTPSSSAGSYTKKEKFFFTNTLPSPVASSPSSSSSTSSYTSNSSSSASSSTGGGAGLARLAAGNLNTKFQSQRSPSKQQSNQFDVILEEDIPQPQPSGTTATISNTSFGGAGTGVCVANPFFAALCGGSRTGSRSESSGSVATIVEETSGVGASSIPMDHQPSLLEDEAGGGVGPVAQFWSKQRGSSTTAASYNNNNNTSSLSITCSSTSSHSTNVGGGESATRITTPDSAVVISETSTPTRSSSTTTSSVPAVEKPPNFVSLENPLFQTTNAAVGDGREGFPSPPVFYPSSSSSAGNHPYHPTNLVGGDHLPSMLSDPSPIIHSTSSYRQKRSERDMHSKERGGKGGDSTMKVVPTPGRAKRTATTPASMTTTTSATTHSTQSFSSSTKASSHSTAPGKKSSKHHHRHSPLSAADEPGHHQSHQTGGGTLNAEETSKTISAKIGSFLRKASFPSTPLFSGVPFATSYGANSGEGTGLFRGYFLGGSKSSRNSRVGRSQTNSTLSGSSRYGGPSKSQSEMALNYNATPHEHLDSPEGGYHAQSAQSSAEGGLSSSATAAPAAASVSGGGNGGGGGSGTAYGRDPERESISSASSLEITVNS